MNAFRPKYITFDCYGTLTNFRPGPMAAEFFTDRIPAEKMPAFLKDFSAYRLDEVLGAWKPYAEVLHNSLERTCKRWNVEFRPDEAGRIYRAVPTWGPHPDVSEPLSRVATKIPLVILSNAMNEQIHDNVALLGAPFAHVYTAQDAQAYKPRLQAFEYMMDNLGCAPEEIMHVSSSFRYDQMSARDMGFGARVWVNRGHEPRCEGYATHEIADIGGLPALVGLQQDAAA